MTTMNFSLPKALAQSGGSSRCNCATCLCARDEAFRLLARQAGYSDGRDRDDDQSEWYLNRRYIAPERH